MNTGKYATALNEQLTYLVEFTRSISELDMAGALFGEFRGAQDAGWSTMITAYEVHAELKQLGSKGSSLTIPELRQVLCLYAQLAEAGGVYEALLNLMGVVQSKPWNLWPFQDMVRVAKNPDRIIGPNANAMFRRLARTATEIGMPKLAGLLEVTFRDDIRNGIFHADYILGPDGLRLRRRNGGYASVISFEDLSRDLSIALAFFELLDAVQVDARQSFRPAREIIGRFSMNPPMKHTVELAPDGAFSIRSDAIGMQTDDAYVRQEHINRMLGGRVFAGYAREANATVDTLLTEMLKIGFEVLLVELKGENLATLLDEIRENDLWRKDAHREAFDNCLLLATPSGFTWILDIATFKALLPSVEPIAIDEAK